MAEQTKKPRIRRRPRTDLEPVYQDGGVPEEDWISVAPPAGTVISWQLARPIHTGGTLPEA